MATSQKLPTTSVLTLLLLVPSIFPHLCSSTDTLSFGHSLSGNQTIVSKQGLFELGFFSPGTSCNHYLGIWYKNIQVRTVVWVANRETPLSDPSSSELRISENGTLALTSNHSNIPIWSSSSSSNPGPRSRNNSTAVVLLDTGNLVLLDGSLPNSSDPFWQSFDHPTDTVLPGAKVGYNRTSGQSWSLTSWRSPDDPSPGSYTLEMDPAGTTQYVMLWNGTRPYWKSGVWDGHIFSDIPEMTQLQEYGVTHYSGNGGNYFTYLDHDPTGVSGMLVDAAGQLRWQKWSFESRQWVVFTFLPKDSCDVYLRCGAFGACTASDNSCQCLRGFGQRSPEDWERKYPTGGCVRRVPLVCSSNITSAATKDGFYEVPAMNLPINPTPSDAKSVDECEFTCSNDCSCTAYSYDNNGCLIWKGEIFNLKQSSDGGPDVLHLRLAASDLPSLTPAKKQQKTTRKLAHWLLAGTALLLFLLAASVTVLLLLSRRRRRRRQSAPAIPGFLVPYRYSDLRAATRNFSDRLGRGGFGSVYRGTLPDKTPIAVKKLEGVGQGEKQFRVEVSAMAMVQHMNVLQLRGFCCQGAERLLVYDYMPNGSLDAYLLPRKNSESAGRTSLGWDARMLVAVGVARGLSYLHEKCRERVIHCDVKPENILLDEVFCPKVADFGMAKLLGRDFSRVLTTMRGTLGYLAPEWIAGGAITPKADVYSFGMMLFEIVSGRRNNYDAEGCGGGPCGDEEMSVASFPVWAARNVAEGEEAMLEDCDFGGGDVEGFRRACRVACWCVQDEEENRPTMGEVVQMLEGVVERGVPPVPRCLWNLVESEDALVRKLSFYSVIDV